jgi:hypothetical protein
MEKALPYMLLFTLVTVSVFASSPSLAQRAPECEVENFVTDLKRLDQDIKKDEGQSWQKVRKFVARCPDDGFWAEAYSDLVTRQLAANWKDFENFLEIAKTDRDFYHFTLRHLDATVSPTDLEMVVKNTQDRCPDSARRICSELGEQARASLEDQRILKERMLKQGTGR